MMTIMYGDITIHFNQPKHYGGSSCILLDHDQHGLSECPSHSNNPLKKRVITQTLHTHMQSLSSLSHGHILKVHYIENFFNLNIGGTTIACSIPEDWVDVSNEDVIVTDANNTDGKNCNAWRWIKH